MTRDYMHRECTLIVLDENLRRICVSIIGNLVIYEILKGLGDDQEAKAYRIMVSAYKRAARYIVSRAEDLDLIAYDDWIAISHAIVNIGLDPEDRI